MRVVVVHNLADGGAHRRLRNQLSAIDAECHEVALASADPVTADPHIVRLSRTAERLPRSLRVPARYADLVALVRAWRAAADATTQLRPDVVFANPCQFLQGPLAVRWLSNFPVVYFCDEPRRVDTEPAAAAGRNRITMPVYWPVYRAERLLDHSVVGSVDRFLTNSRYTASAIRTAYHVDADVVPMGVAAPFLLEPPRRAAEHLLTVGHLIPAKGHDLVIRAAAATSLRWPVVIVTPKLHPAEATRLHALARTCGVNLNIRVGISDDELREAYARAVTTVYLARREPLGLASLEAQACGSPVVVADEGGLPETVCRNETGLIVARDAFAAARAIDRLHDAETRERFGAAARLWAERFTWLRSGQVVDAALRDTSMRWVAA